MTARSGTSEERERISPRIDGTVGDQRRLDLCGDPTHPKVQNPIPASPPKTHTSTDPTPQHPLRHYSKPRSAAVDYQRFVSQTNSYPAQYTRTLLETPLSLNHLVPFYDIGQTTLSPVSDSIAESLNGLSVRNNGQQRRSYTAAR